jgi:hypothetical protein
LPLSGLSSETTFMNCRNADRVSPPGGITTDCSFDQLD